MIIKYEILQKQLLHFTFESASLNLLIFFLSVVCLKIKYPHNFLKLLSFILKLSFILLSSSFLLIFFLLMKILLKILIRITDKIIPPQYGIPTHNINIFFSFEYILVYMSLLLSFNIFKI